MGKSLVSCFFLRHSVEWAAEGGKMRVGRPNEHGKLDTVNDDLKEMRFGWKDAKSVAGNRTMWGTLVAQCSSGKQDELSLRSKQVNKYNYSAPDGVL